ncbi:MAG: tetratricopeptide repeat protein [Actinocatenispora sp.]
MTGEPDEVRGAGADVRTFIQRADLLDDLGHYAEAAEELRDALRLEPDNPEALATLGMVQFRAGRAPQALVSARAALAVQPDHLLGQVVQGHVLASLGSRAEALAAADELLAVDPGSWLRQVHFATIVRQVRNGQASLDAAWSAVKLAPDEPQTHLALSAVAADLGLREIAAHAHAEAVRLDPRVAEVTPPDPLRMRPGRPSGRPAPDEMTSDAEHDAGSAEDVPGGPRAPGDLSGPGGTGTGLRTGVSRFLAFGALYAWGGPLLIALWMLVGTTAAQVVSGVAGVLGVVVFGSFRAQPRTGPEPVLRVLGRLDRWLAAACVAVLACPPMLLAYAVSGTPWPLGVMILLGAGAFAALVLRAHDVGRPGAPRR